MPTENKLEATSEPQTPETLTDDSFSPIGIITNRRMKFHLRGMQRSSEETQKDDVPNIYKAGFGPSTESHLPENVERDIQRRQRGRNENIRLQDLIRPIVPEVARIANHPQPRREPGPPRPVSPPSDEIDVETDACSSPSNRRWLIGGAIAGITLFVISSVLFMTTYPSRGSATIIIEHATNISTNITDIFDQSPE